ncbi:MAG: L,D-transpeptidase [Myxococcales bacterium]|nr:L,D-transpeptidase [Myxococcales bacterium]
MNGRTSTRWLALVAGLLACGGKSGEPRESAGDAPDEATAATLEARTEAAEDEGSRRAREETLDREYPLHGLVTRPQLVIRSEPDGESRLVGWLRWGERVRLKREPTRTSACSSGWFELAPRGWVCAGQGVEVGDAPPEVEDPVAPARRDEPLPYLYYFVKEPLVPQYHQPPSRDQQRAAQAWVDRYYELRGQNERQAERFFAGELGPASQRHPVIASFLQRGFFIAGSDVLVRAQRRFVRATGGGFVKEAQLEPRTGHDFQGVELGDGLELPIPWLVRTGHPMIHRERADGTARLVRDEDLQPIERQTMVAAIWRGRHRIGDGIYHRLEGPDWEGPRYLRHHFVSVAEAIEPPFEVEDDEPWIHVDLSEQTLVVYRGRRPVYATLVSTGLAEHATPTGTFTIQRKHVTDTMANLGPEAGDDAYRIQDVPWTQYFDGSIALHTAFWHTRFGLPRSHGCVNLAPADAHRVFRETWPRVPDGWHGVSTDRTGFRGSRVHVTE